MCDTVRTDWILWFDLARGRQARCCPASLQLFCNNKQTRCNKNKDNLWPQLQSNDCLSTRKNDSNDSV